MPPCMFTGNMGLVVLEIEKMQHVMESSQFSLWDGGGAMACVSATNL